MNKDQVTRIRASFEALAPQADRLMDHFYARLFVQHPEVRALFPDDMSGQKQKLKASIALVVKNADRLDEITPALREMGARHVKYGTQEAHYPVVRDTLLDVMAGLAGELWTSQLAQDWTAALNAVAGVMIEGAQQAQRRAA